MAGSILFSDTGNHRVRRIAAPAGGGTDDHADTAAGTGPGDVVTAGPDGLAANLERAGDLNCFRFTASPGSSYSLATRLGTLNDTVLTLFDRDGAHVLAENDDAGGSRASRLDGFRPREAGTYFARVRAFQAQATGTYRVSVEAQALSTAPVLATTSVPDATLGVPYGFTFEVVGGQPPYRFTAAGGGLPPGLALDPAGLLLGTPAALGDFRFAVASKDANDRGATAGYLLTVRVPGAVPFPESAHPYPGGADEEKSFRLAGSPAAINVLFDDRTVVEPGFDFLHVADGSGTPVPGSPFTGSFLAGRTLRIPGDTVRIRLVSDSSIAGFGYRVLDVTEAGAAAETLAVEPAVLPGARPGSF
ncbi:MAG: pre-peptidase C-terminal domain-containing protein [Acidobacteria bacterium]|nr:pre-peptidase C-terminal domain-containing protein [Acidobacteriota bacterium]